MNDNVIPMVKTVQWHPMLPEIIGGDIAHRYMAISKTDGEFYSRCQKDIRPVKAPDTLEAILDFYEQMHGSKIKSLLNTGIEIIVDFKRQRLTLTNDGRSLIYSPNNTPFTWGMDKSPYFESKASTYFALHWLKNNAIANEDMFDIAVGNEVDSQCKGACEERINNVLDFNQWREKIAKLT